MRHKRVRPANKCVMALALAVLSLVGALVLIAAMQGTASVARAGTKRSIAGSSVTPDRSCYSPGSSDVYILTVYNASTDLEWLDVVTFTFPSDWSVTLVATDTQDSCGNDVGFSASSIVTNQITFTDNDGDWGEVYGGCSWSAAITVTVPVSATGEQTVGWALSGDDWEDTPHDITGSFTLSTGLFLDPDTLRAGAIPGDNAHYTLTLYNYTGAARHITFAYSSTWPITGFASLSSVASCTWVTLPVTVTVPSGTLTGTMNVATVTATSGVYTDTALLRTYACISPTGVSLGSDSPVESGQPMHFTAVISPADATGPFIYDWDFGGSGSVSGTNMATPVYTYTATGGYTVAITVTGQCGAPVSATLPVTVTVGPCVYLPVVMREYTTSHSPNVPSNPFPADNAINQIVNVNLSWSGGDPDGDSVTYDVYFESDASPPGVLVSDDQPGASYDPGTLITDTHYYWQIVATDEHEATTIGPVWNFTTTTEGVPAAGRYAVIVGVAEYLDPYSPDLAYTDDDAIEFRQTLLDRDGFREEDILLLIDSDATKSAIQNGITNWLASREGPDAMVVFFFSGHGAQGPDLSPIDEADGFDEYLIPHDYGGTTDTAIRDDELDHWLDTLDSTQVVVIVDSCYSGGFIGAASIEGVQCRCLPPIGGVRGNVMVGDGFVRDINRPGRLVLTASREDQVSYEFGPPYEQGVFTYYLLEALETATADGSSNGWVSGEEAYDYLAPRVDTLVFSVVAGAHQNPQESDNVTGEVDLTQP